MCHLFIVEMSHLFIVEKISIFHSFKFLNTVSILHITKKKKVFQKYMQQATKLNTRMEFYI